MKKKVTCLILSTLILSTYVPLTAFAGDLPDIKLEVPEFEVPDNMPDAFESLRDKYDMALEGLKAEGFGVNNFPNGLGELEPPPGFGSKAKSLPSAESLFVEKYGDMWKKRTLNKDFALQHLEGKDETIDEWEKSHPTDKKELKQKSLESFQKMSQAEFDSYVDNLAKTYKEMFKTLDGEKAYNSMPTSPSLKATNKWADIMKSPEEVAKEHQFMTEAEKSAKISSRTKPEGFDEINSQHVDQDAFIKAKQIESEDNRHLFEKAIDGVKDFLFGEDEIGKMAKQQKEQDKKRYKDTYEKYYYQGGQHTSKEQKEQRRKILDVFEEHGIYEEKRDFSDSNKEKMGKLIEDNIDLLEKEIPGFKSFK